MLNALVPCYVGSSIVPSVSARHGRPNFYVLLAVHLSIILDNDQRDTHLLYFTIRLL